MIRLGEVLDLEKLSLLVKDGYIRIQHHPTLAYVIYNYTEKCAYEKEWNAATKMCRGLIVHKYTGAILARPFEKFFNYGEVGAHEFEQGDPVRVHDKVDGSLGILYPIAEGRFGYQVATRGSFTSDQARHATRVWNDRYREVPVPYEVTPLFEIVYPSNRIVVDYGQTDDLVLLGLVDIPSGITMAPCNWEDWPGPRAESFPFPTFYDALRAEPRPGKEGIVVSRFAGSGMVKIKQDDYVALHRILTNVTARHLWEFLAVTDCWDHAPETGTEDKVGYLVRKLRMDPKRIEQIRAAGDDWLDIYKQGVPEEFLKWVDQNVARLKELSEHHRVRVALEYYDIAGETVDFDRKEFVRKAREQSPDTWRLLMTLLDGKEIRTWTWLECYPEAERPFKVDEG